MEEKASGGGPRHTVRRNLAFLEQQQQLGDRNNDLQQLLRATLNASQPCPFQDLTLTLTLCFFVFYWGFDISYPNPNPNPNSNYL